MVQGAVEVRSLVEVPGEYRTESRNRSRLVNNFFQFPHALLRNSGDKYNKTYYLKKDVI
jgi:hypothetical protein